jgi:hypothetical protein
LNNDNLEKLLKVSMGSQSVWGDGWYYADEMVNAARSSGYDALFFGDNGLRFVPGKLADPSFEDVDSAGKLTKWYTNTTGSMNQIAYAGPFGPLPPKPSNIAYTTNETQLLNYYHALQRIHSGNYSLHLEVQSNGGAISPADAGYAFVRDIFPGGYVSANQNPPTHPLLLDNVTFSAYVWLDSLAYAHQQYPEPSLKYGDNGWFYVRFYFVTDRGPRSEQRLIATIIYSDHAVDNFLRTIRGQLNTTNSKSVYQNIPPLSEWLYLQYNVTDLARALFNETIAENWRLGNFEIGVRSYNQGLVDAYVDDVSVQEGSLNPLEYFKSTIEPRLSTADLAVYPGYSINVLNQVGLYVYGTTYLDLGEKANLTDPTYWDTISKAVSSEGGRVFMGPITSLVWQEYLIAIGGFDIPIVDGTTFTSLSTAGALMDSGQPIVFTATREIILPSAYNNATTWSVRVLAQNNTEQAILDAIASGRAYLASSNFTGTFETTAYGFPRGRNPIYIPSGANASIRISFTGLQPGIVRVYQGGELALKEAHNGAEAMVENFTIRQGHAPAFFVTASSTNDALALVGDPLTFDQTSMIPGGALFIDNDAWSVQSTQWVSSGTEQRMRLVVNGPADTDAKIYLFSPDFSPSAKSADHLLRSISVNNVTVDPASVYNSANSTFLFNLRSTGSPIEILLNFDIQNQAYIYDVVQSVAALYVLAVFPLAIVALYSAVARLRRERKGRMGTEAT